MEKINDLENIYLFCAKYFTENKIKNISYAELGKVLNKENKLITNRVSANNPKLNPDLITFQLLLAFITSYLTSTQPAVVPSADSQVNYPDERNIKSL